MNATFLQRWDMAVHERGHFLHISTGTGMYGMAHNFKIFQPQLEPATKVQQYYSYEMYKANVTYLADVNTLCDDTSADVTVYADINTCVQESIQGEIGCRLPWLKNNSSKYDDLPLCETKSHWEQYFK